MNGEITTNLLDFIKNVKHVKKMAPPNQAPIFKTIELQEEEFNESDLNSKSWLIRTWAFVCPFVLVLFIGFFVATFAVFVDLCSDFLIDLKDGYCSYSFYLKKSTCCNYTEKECNKWRTWAEVFGLKRSVIVEWTMYVVGGTLFALSSTWLAKKLSKYAGGSGISEVMSALDGFCPKSLFEVKTLLTKTVSLVFAVASGLSLGKEGPSVHIACCIGALASKIINNYDKNKDLYKIINISSAAGIAVALGSPIGGILYAIEELKIKFTAKNVVMSFFCALVAISTFHLYDPFKTGKIVMFQSKTSKEWKTFEIIVFVIIGILGALSSAFIIKASIWMAKIRRFYKFNSLVETLTLSIITSVISFTNSYLKIGMLALLEILFEDCALNKASYLCKSEHSLKNSVSLVFASIVRTILTSLTYGITAPTGIFIPSMAIGASFGRAIGILLQSLHNSFPDLFLFRECQSDSSQCINPELYALLGAASGLCGITKLCLTVVLIMFELTGALQYMLPIMITVASTKLIGDIFYSDGIAEEFISCKGIPKLNYFDTDTNIENLNHRTHLVSLNLENNSIEYVENILDKHNYNRIFIKDPSNSSVVGYVFTKELKKNFYFNPPCSRQDKVSFKIESTDNINIGEILKKNFVVVQKSVKINKIIEIFRETKHGFVLITDRNNQRSIVTKKDIVNIHYNMKYKIYKELQEVEDSF